MSYPSLPRFLVLTLIALGSLAGCGPEALAPTDQPLAAEVRRDELMTCSATNLGAGSVGAAMNSNYTISAIVPETGGVLRVSGHDISNGTTFTGLVSLGTGAWTLTGSFGSPSLLAYISSITVNPNSLVISGTQRGADGVFRSLTGTITVAGGTLSGGSGISFSRATQISAGTGFVTWSGWSSVGAFLASNSTTYGTCSVVATETGTTGNVTLAATAAGATSVAFFVDGASAGSDATSPFSVTYDSTKLQNGTHSLYVEATDETGNRSRSATISFTTSNVDLGATVTASETGTTNTVTLAATTVGVYPVSKVEFYIDNTLVATDTTSPFSVGYNSRLLTNGAHSLVAKATDSQAVTTSSAAVSFTTSNDFVGPTGVTATETGTTGNVSFTAAATDPAGINKVEYYVDGVLAGTTNGSVSPWTFTFNSRTVANGPHTVVARAYDAYLNFTNSAGVAFTTSNDLTGPTAVTGSVTGTTGTITLAGSATDPSGLSKLEFYVDNVLKGTDTTSPYSVTTDSRLLTNAAHALTVKAYDVFGQVTTSTAVSFTTSNDFTGPTVSMTEAGTTGTITLSATATDPSGVSKVEFYVDGVLRGTDAVAPYALSYNSRALANGAHTAYAKAYDVFNQVTTSTTVSFSTTNDFVGPTVTLTETGTAGTISFSATASDPSGVSKVEFYVDGLLKGTVTAAPYTFAYNSRLLANAAHTSYAKAYDTFSQATASTTVSFTTNNDFAGPTVTLAETGTTGTITFTATASDPSGVSKVEFYVDGTLRSTVTAAPYTFSYNSRLLTNAAHTSYARAFDTFNQSTTSTTVSFTTSNDLGGPTVSMTESGTANNVTFTATATDPSGVSKVEFYVDGVLKGTVSAAPYTLVFDSRTLTNATHSVYARAYDTFSQVTNSTAVSFATSNDFTAPTATVAVVGTSATITFNATASDASGVSKVDFYVDGVLKGTDTTSPFSLAFDSKTLVNGAHSVFVRASDPYNQSGSSPTVAFSVTN